MVIPLENKTNNSDQSVQEISSSSESTSRSTSESASSSESDGAVQQVSDDTVLEVSDDALQEEIPQYDGGKPNPEQDVVNEPNHHEEVENRHDDGNENGAANLQIINRSNKRKEKAGNTFFGGDPILKRPHPLSFGGDNKPKRLCQEMSEPIVPSDRRDCTSPSAEEIAAAVISVEDSDSDEVVCTSTDLEVYEDPSRDRGFSNLATRNEMAQVVSEDCASTSRPPTQHISAFPTGFMIRPRDDIIVIDDDDDVVLVDVDHQEPPYKKNTEN